MYRGVYHGKQAHQGIYVLLIEPQSQLSYRITNVLSLQLIWTVSCREHEMLDWRRLIISLLVCVLLLAYCLQVIVTGGNLEQSREALVLAESHGKG